MLKRTIELARNTLQAKNDFQALKMRRPVNFFEVTAFGSLMSLSKDLPAPSKMGIQHLYLLQDFMERQNFRTDEAGMSESIWDQQCILELHALLSQIAAEYENTHGDDAESRFSVFFSALQAWYCSNPIIEDFIHEKQAHPDPDQSAILNRISNTDPSERASVHKEEVAMLWISASLAALYEGSSTEIESATECTHTLTMLYQVSEDFVNLERDWRVNKKSLFTSGFDSLQEAKRAGLKLFLKYLQKYFSVIENNFLKLVIVEVWLVRTIHAYLAAKKYGTVWRQIDRYQSADLKERQIGGMHLDNSLQLPLKGGLKPLIAQSKHSDVYQHEDVVIKVPKKARESTHTLAEIVEVPEGMRVESTSDVLISGNDAEGMQISVQKKVDGSTLRNMGLEGLSVDALQSLLQLNAIEQNLLRDGMFFDSVGRGSESSDGMLTKVKMLLNLYGYSSNIMQSQDGELVIIDEEVYDNKSPLFRFVIGVALKLNRLKLSGLAKKQPNLKPKSRHSKASQN